MVSKAIVVSVLSVLVIVQFTVFIYLYTKPRAVNNSSNNSLGYILISKFLDSARHSLGLKNSDSPLLPSKDELKQSSPTNNQTTNNTYTSDSQSFNNTWKEGSFCHDFLANTFHNSIPLCNSQQQPSDSVKCYGNSNSKHMARCELENVALRPSKLAAALFDADNVKFAWNEDCVQILEDKGTSCPKPNSAEVAGFMEDGDYIRHLVSIVAKGKQTTSSVCQKWINKTAFLFTTHPSHIYFRFLDYYNLHKALSDYNLHEDDCDVVRVSTGTSEYHYQDFEQALYPNVIHISDFPSIVTCYRRVVLVPKSYASTPFQCKMHWSLKEQCMKCDGRGMSNSDLQTFRKRVLNACSLDDEKHFKNSSVVLISRKPYIRSPDDELRKFERVLTNEGDLVKGIKSTFPSTNVTVAHLEDLPVCDQVRYANQADVLLAVHGAGLVHLWWLRDESLALEMEPHYEAGNPSFEVLSKLTGRKYRNNFIGGDSRYVNVNVKEIIGILGSQESLHH